MTPGDVATLICEAPVVKFRNEGIDNTASGTVVVFTDAFFEINGVGSYYRTLLAWCARTGQGRVVIICPERTELVSGEIPREVIPVRAVPHFRNPFYKDLVLGHYFTNSLARLLRAITGPKVIHCATSGPLGLAGIRVAKLLKLNSVGWYHTDLQSAARVYGRSIAGRLGEWVGGGMAYACDRSTYARCRAVCAPSDSALKTAQRVFDGPTSVIPDPVDTERFQPSQSRQGTFRDRYGKKGTVLVVVVGRLAKEKNLDLICELSLRDPRIRLVFVGDGPHAPVLRDRWGACVTGFLAGQRLLDAYQQADVLVQLSECETFGLALIEALACGLPAVVLKSGGLVARIPAQCGVEILERHELPQLADRCVAICTNSGEYAERSRRVRAFALNYGADAVMPRFFEFHEPYMR